MHVPWVRVRVRPEIFCRTWVRVRVGCHQVTPAGGLHPSSNQKTCGIDENRIIIHSITIVKLAFPPLIAHSPSLPILHPSSGRLVHSLRVEAQR